MNTLSASVEQQLVKAIYSACQFACAAHDPSQGSNNFTFGIQAYNSCVFHLKKLAEETPETSDPRQLSFRIAQEHPTFRLQCGEAKIGCYRVGASANDSIYACFPRTKSFHPNLRFRREQFSLPFATPQTSEPNIQEGGYDLVLAHMSNPEEGLCALYLCRPSKSSNGQVVEWAEVKKLWDKQHSVVYH